MANDNKPNIDDLAKKLGLDKEQAQLLKEALQNQKELNDLYSQAVDLAESKLKTYQTIADINADEEGFEDARLEQLRAKHRQTVATGALTAEQIQQSEKLLAKAEQEVQAKRNLYSLGAGLVEQTTGVSDKWKSGILPSIWNSEKGVRMFVKGLSKSFTWSNVLGSSMQKVFESTAINVKAFDQLQSQLNATTGAGGQYNEQLVDIADSNRDIGVGFAASAKAVGDLHSGMTGFTSQSKATQNEIAGVVGGLEKLGISGSVSAKTMDDLVKGFGMTALGAAEVQKDLAGTAMALGIPPSQMAEGFAQAMPQLAAWGKDSIKIFKKVASASKALGVEMSTLLGFAGQFDTFESAAGAVGKLNALMGGDALNAYQMMNASEEERIELLLESTKLNGVVWQDLNKFERMAFASAAGITDMNEANKLFGGGIDVYNKAQKNMFGVVVTAEELEKRQKAAVSMQEKLNMMFESFAFLVEPIVDKAHQFVNALMSLDGPAAVVATIVGGMLGLAVALGFIASKIAPLKGIADILWSKTARGRAAKAAAAQAASSFTISGSIAGQTTAMTTAQPIMNAYIGTLHRLANAAARAAPSLASASAAMIGMTLPIGLIVLGVLAISIAIAFIVYQFVQLAKVAINNVESFLMFSQGVALAAVSVGALVLSFAALVFSIAAIAAASPGLLVFAMAIGAVGLAFKFLPSAVFDALNSVGVALKEMSGANVVTVTTMFKTMGQLETDKLEKVNKVLENIQITASLVPEGISIGDVPNNAAKMDVMIQELKEINKNMKNMKTSGGEAVVNIDGRAAGKLLYPHFNKIQKGKFSSSTNAAGENE